MFGNGHKRSYEGQNPRVDAILQNSFANYSAYLLLSVLVAKYRTTMRFSRMLAGKMCVQCTVYTRFAVSDESADETRLVAGIRPNLSGRGTKGALIGSYYERR